MQAVEYGDELVVVTGSFAELSRRCCRPADLLAGGNHEPLPVEWTPAWIRLLRAAGLCVQDEVATALGFARGLATRAGLLASSEASFITGAVLAVDGGYLAQ